MTDGARGERQRPPTRADGDGTAGSGRGGGAGQPPRRVTSPCRWLTALGLAATLATLLACRGDAPGAGGAAGASAATTPGPAQRIVAVAPSAAELLWALGLGDRVVGVGDHVTWPPEARRLPRLGGLLDPRLETVAALRPDLAVLLPSERELGERLAALGVGVLVVPHETLDDVERAAVLVAERAGVPAAGAAFAARWRRDLAPRPLPGRPRVALVVARQPGELGRPLLAGPGSFLDELLGRLGAANAFADAGLAWPQVALEEIVARDPDVIVELQPQAPAPADAERLRADWARLPTLSAVRGGRVVVLGGDHALVPGPRLPRLYAELHAALAGVSGTGVSGTRYETDSRVAGTRYETAAPGDGHRQLRIVSPKLAAASGRGHREFRIVSPKLPPAAGGTGAAR